MYILVPTTSGPHYILKKIFNNAAARFDQLEQANYYAYQHILKNCDFLKNNVTLGLIS